MTIIDLNLLIELSLNLVSKEIINKQKHITPGRQKVKLRGGGIYRPQHFEAKITCAITYYPDQNDRVNL